MALYRDLKFEEGSGNILTDEVVGATLTPEIAGKDINWGYDYVNGIKRPYLAVCRENKRYAVEGIDYTWFGTPYGSTFFDGSNNSVWTVAVQFRSVMNATGIIFNSSSLKLTYSNSNRILWGNGGDEMVSSAQFLTGKWVTLIFSSNDGNNVKVWFEDMEDSSILKTFSKGVGGARLSGFPLRTNFENTESNAGPCHIARLTFWTHELNETERVTWQDEQGGKASNYNWFFSNFDHTKLGMGYPWSERDNRRSASWPGYVSFRNRNWQRWRFDGATCQGCTMGQIPPNITKILFRSTTFFLTESDFVNGAFYTLNFRIFGLFSNSPLLADDLISLQLLCNVTTNDITLYEVRYRNSGGTNQILLDGREVPKGIEIQWRMEIDFTEGKIDVWMNGDKVLDSAGAGGGLTLNILPRYWGIGPWQGVHLYPAIPPESDYAPSTDYTGGEYYEIDQYVGEIERQGEKALLLQYGG